MIYVIRYTAWLGHTKVVIPCHCEPQRKSNVSISLDKQRSLNYSQSTGCFDVCLHSAHCNVHQLDIQSQIRPDLVYCIELLARHVHLS